MTTAPWIYKGEPFTTHPEGLYGFVYLLIFGDGSFYIGRTKFNSNWKRYFGGGDLVKQKLKKYGKDFVKRIIVSFCESQWLAEWDEVHLQREVRAVENPKYLNLQYGGGNYEAPGKRDNHLKGKKLPQWWCDRIREGQRKNPRPKETPEHIEARASQMRGRKRPKHFVEKQSRGQYKEVVVVLKTGEVLEFESKLALQKHFKRRNLSAMLNGKVPIPKTGTLKIVREMRYK